MNRFSFPDFEGIGRQIIERSTSLEIRLHKIKGKLCASYELHGSVGSDPFEDCDDDEGDLLGKRPDNDERDMRFIVDLLGEFEKANR